jgi:hypothetical protein
MCFFLSHQHLTNLREDNRKLLILDVLAAQLGNFSLPCGNFSPLAPFIPRGWSLLRCSMAKGASTIGPVLA